LAAAAGRGAPRQPPLQGWPVPECVARLHAALRPATYLEIGTGERHMLALATCAAAGIGCGDAAPAPPGGRPSVFLHPGAAGRFFARFDPAHVLGGPVEFAVLDGDRRFESLLRDFIEVERHCAPGAVVALLNCVPRNLLMTERDRARAVTHWEQPYAGWWTGDVWKVVALLHRHRPDLSIAAYDAAPAGLVLVTGLDPGSAVLRDRFAALVEDAAAWPSPAALDAYWRGLALRSTHALAEIGPVAPAREAALRARAAALINDFESLGDDCEFGIVQRHLGQEPLSLLRFASFGSPAGTRLQRTARAVEQRFAALGQPGSVRLMAPDAAPKREMMLVDAAYNITYHGFLAEGSPVTAAAVADFVAAQPRRLRFLRDKLLENMGDGDKLFVWKSMARHTRAERDVLLSPIRRIGAAWLLWIDGSDAEHPAGSVELAEPGLLLGYISRSDITNVALQEWSAIAVRAHAIWRAHVPRPCSGTPAR
jgi:hypothetical protein